MSDTDQYRLTIDRWTPETIPMERLAAYMADFARVLGETTAVHFVDVEPGSAKLVARPDSASGPSVESRMLRVRAGDPPDDAARRGLKGLDDSMRRDSANGAITGPGEVVYVDFKGRGGPQPVAFGPFRERHSLHGVVVKIGGIDNSIPVWLKDGDAPPHICEASVEMSTRLAAYYRKGIIRVHGIGTWLRGPDGVWGMQKFRIDDFDPLDDKPLVDVVRELEAAGGSRWHEAPDPLEEGRRLRSGDD